MSSLEPHSTISHYRIVSPIGAGGMGEVYLAEDTSELGRRVALKILPAEVAGDKDRLQRFIQEARTVSNLNHPNIITVYEFGQTETTSFMATEYIDGVTLRQHLSNRRLKLVEMLDVAIQIVAALNAAHEAGVTHRDLKPENVMVRRDHIVKVLDFGLAKPLTPSPDKRTGSEIGTRVLVHTEPGVVMGTAGYMSPEQTAGEGIDHRTDIWSFGVVLYEMIAGCLPFEGKDIHRQIISIQEVEPLPLSRQVEGVPERLEEIVAKCLAKEKEERYQTAKDLLIDLRNLRRRMDVDAEIERTVSPRSGTTSGGRSSASIQSAPTGASTPVVSEPQAVSSAEYIVRGLKRHRLAAGGVLLLIVAGIAAMGLIFGFGNNRDAIDSIAVLPFENRSPEADTEYLSEGLTESLIYRLSQLPDLKVSPTSAAFRYRGREVDAQRVGRELAVSAVMTGRILQRGENLTISVELVDVKNNGLIWGEQYERKMSELLAMQREIAAEIVDKLQLKRSGESEQKLAKRYTNNNEAYQLYLKGRFYWNKRTTESLRQAVGFYKQAIEKDPGFALAFSGLAETYVLFPNYEVAPPSDCMPQAKAAALRALELDETLAEAHTAVAWYYCQFEFDWVSAERGLRRAIDINPNYATAHQWLAELLAQTKRFDESEYEVRQAQELDPLSPIIGTNVGWHYFLARRYDEAIKEVNRTLSLSPDFPVAQGLLCWAYNTKNMFNEAIPACRQALELVGGAYDKGYLSLVLGRAGQRAEAKKLLEELKAESERRYVPGTAIALAHLGLNERGAALQMLEKEVVERGYWASTFAVAPELDELRSEPRFKALIKQMNLPE